MRFGSEGVEEDRLDPLGDNIPSSQTGHESPSGMFILLQDHAELVEKAVELAETFHREVATPDDTRRILGLKGKDKVKF